MNNYRLETIYSSTYPIDCHIIKGRLETEGIDCFIYNENIISVEPFWSVSIGGVKLKVPSDEVEMANSILQRLDHHLLIDENGEYEIFEVFENEISRQNTILNLRNSIQKNPKLLENKEDIKKIVDSGWFSETETNEIISNEIEFVNYCNLKFKLNWKEFWFELLDYERNFFKYLRIKPNKFYLEKDLYDNFVKNDKEKISEKMIVCPICNSTNVKYGHAIDYEFDFLYYQFR